MSAKAGRVGLCALIACGIVYFYPLFRIRTISADANPVTTQSEFGASESRSASATHAGAMIDTLWNERIPAAAKQAVGVDELLALAATDPNAARKKYGREVGMGGPTFVFVRGSGLIQNVHDDECQLAIEGSRHTVVLTIGALFGNAVRDATGLVNVDDFPNSQDFNHLSTELNSRCESSVISVVRHQLMVGVKVEFAGCGEVRDDDGFKPLKLIPVQLAVIDEPRPNP